MKIQYNEATINAIIKETENAYERRNAYENDCFIFEEDANDVAAIYEDSFFSDNYASLGYDY